MNVNCIRQILNWIKLFDAIHVQIDTHAANTHQVFIEPKQVNGRWPYEFYGFAFQLMANRGAHCYSNVFICECSFGIIMFGNACIWHHRSMGWMQTICLKCTRQVSSVAAIESTLVCAIDHCVSSIVRQSGCCWHESLDVARRQTISFGHAIYLLAKCAYRMWWIK